ncbi:MAG: hypothetical protein MTP17_01485 [Candidatus Midichloria sp.]|nr:MAG: hypothetical protein MTP17_01485 [Candidatus Midichloria sp.]
MRFDKFHILSLDLLLYLLLKLQGLRLLTKIRKDMENHLLAIENTA